MRLSVDGDDPGFSYAAFGARVFLGGVELSDCVTADDETGEVVCLARGPDGLFLLDHQAHAVQRVTLQGQVRIEPGPDAD